MVVGRSAKGEMTGKPDSGARHGFSTFALIARGLGFALMPQHNIEHPGVVSRPLVEPTLWREASLFTCRDRANGDSLDALVQEATRITTALTGVPAVGNSLADDAR
jgi:DNA-binding transcriptional LysR family regulator